MNPTEPQSEAPQAEPTPEPSAPPLPAPRRQSVRGLLLWTLLLLLVGLSGAVAWALWSFRADLLEAVEAQQQLLQRLNRQVAGVQDQANQVGTRQNELAQTQQRLSLDVSNLGARLEEGEEAMSRLTDTVHGGRRRYQLLAIEQLLLAANDRLLLAQDVTGAARALEIAEARLAALADPQLFKVRETIAAERAALAAVAAVEVSSLALTLGEMIRRAPEWPLVTEARRNFQPRARTPDAPAAPATEEHWTERAWGKVRQALGALFVLRRDERAEMHLLPEEHEALIRHILLLRLETARFALLRADAGTYRSALNQALAWVNQYYRSEDPGVRAARRELGRLLQQNLKPDLPDLSRSLALLRAQLDATPR